MKKGNYANFMLDLKCRLLDLEYTEQALDDKQEQQLQDQNQNQNQQKVNDELNKNNNTDQSTTITTKNTANISITLSTSPKESLSKEALHQAVAVTRLIIDTMETYATQWTLTPNELNKQSQSKESDNLSTPSDDNDNEKKKSSQLIESIEPADDYQVS